VRPAGNLLLVVKRTSWQIRVEGSEDPHVRGLAAEGAPPISYLLASHDKHLETLERLTTWLDRQRVAWSLRYREGIRGREDLPEGTGLVVAVGGDGTVLHASHSVGSTPLLGVNSFPGRSTGWLCGAGPDTMQAVLADVLEGRLRPLRLTRLATEVAGRALPFPALNDVLVAAPTPAATCTYRLTVPAGCQVQRSSGLWVSTAAGSTGALRSAGGRAQPLGSRRLQFRTREAFSPAAGRLDGGFVRPGEHLALEWLGWEGRLWVDGTDAEQPLRLGDRIRLSGDGEPLRLFRPRPETSGGGSRG